MDKLIVNPKEYKLETAQGVEILKPFETWGKETSLVVPMYEKVVASEITPELSKEARQIRLSLRKIRTSIAKVHKSEKAYYMAGSKFVDAIKNKLTTPITEMEDKLTEIEKFEENRLKQEIKELEDLRRDMLAPFDQPLPQGMGTWTKEQFDVFYAGAKAKFDKDMEDRLKEKEKEEQEKEEQKKIREENEKLLKEKAKQAAIDKAKDAEIARLKEIAKDSRIIPVSPIQSSPNIDYNKLSDADNTERLKRELLSIGLKYSFNSDKHTLMFNRVKLLLNKVVVDIDESLNG